MVGEYQGMTKVLIINQHGSNRGDEAASRGMLFGLNKFIPSAEITILSVYPLSLDGIQNVEIYNNLRIRGLPRRKALGKMLRYLFEFYTGIYKSNQSEVILKKYKDADLIISAPGGPYIGDLYPYTELELLFHIFLGTLTKAPIMIYAPSMGPFERKSMNRWRKWILSRVDLITLREKISAEYLETLEILLDDTFVTADSALQKPVDDDLADKVYNEIGLKKDRKYVGFVPLEMGRFREERSQILYIELLVETLQIIRDRFKTEFVFFPQGYKDWHDLPFIESLVRIAGLQQSSHILSEKYTSNEQQALIAKMDAFISFRYHPGIFALRQYVPCVVVAYEHKILGFMGTLGIEDYCIDLYSVTKDKIIDKLEVLWGESDSLRNLISPKIKTLERKSLLNSYFASLLLEFKSSRSNKDVFTFMKDKLENSDWYD